MVCGAGERRYYGRAMKSSLAAVSILLLCIGARAQADAAHGRGFNKLRPLHGDAAIVRAQIAYRYLPDIITSPKQDLPFTARKVTRLVQALDNGDKIATMAVDRVARDRQGRLFRERHRLAAEGANHVLNQPQIYDLVTRTLYHLGPGRRVLVVPDEDPAYFRERGWMSPCKRSLYDGNEEQRIEDLGEKEIAGVATRGFRVTATFAPAVTGAAMPVTVVDEFWYSDELGTDVMIRHSDPLTGVKTLELTEVERTEPDPQLFRVPVGYEERIVQRTK